MGRDKLNLEVGGRPLLLHVLDALSPRCEEVIVVGYGGEIRSGTKVRSVPDRRPGREGPLAGLEAGLAAAECQLVFVAAGDMPFLSDEFASALLDRLAEGGFPVVVPWYGDRPHPLCAAYDRNVLPQVSRTLDGGVRAMREFLARLEGVVYVEKEELRRFGEPEVFLMNVNSPGDLERARGLACGREG